MATQVQTFDPVQYKATTREQWQNAAEAWSRWEPTLKAWLGPATVVMLDLADIGPGVDSEVRHVVALLGLDLPLVGLVDRPDQVIPMVTASWRSRAGTPRPRRGGRCQCICRRRCAERGAEEGGAIERLIG